MPSRLDARATGAQRRGVLPRQHRVVVAALSLRLVVQGWLGLAIAGSMALFVVGVAIYLFAIASLSIFLATLARSMPQFALFAFPVFIIMNWLSGGNTPLDSIPRVLQTVMQGSPSTHFVSFAQAILYRGAGSDIVWPEFAATADIGAVFFVSALLRYAKLSLRCRRERHILDARPWPARLPSRDPCWLLSYHDGLPSVPQTDIQTQRRMHEIAIERHLFLS